VAVFRQRIFHHGCERYHLGIGRDHLLSYGIFRIVRINQRDEVRRNIHAEQAAGIQGFLFGLVQRNHFVNFFHRIQAVT
jgi:hypothetical protein